MVQQATGARHQNMWGPPAGHANPGENPHACALRETKEETGLKIDIGGIVQCGFLNHKKRDYLLVIYHSTLTDRKRPSINKNEIQNYVWASLRDIKEDKYPLRKKFLKDPLILSLTRKPFPLNVFDIYHVEND